MPTDFVLLLQVEIWNFGQLNNAKHDTTLKADNWTAIVQQHVEFVDVPSCVRHQLDWQASTTLAQETWPKPPPAVHLCQQSRALKTPAPTALYTRHKNTAGKLKTKPLDSIDKPSSHIHLTSYRDIHKFEHGPSLGHTARSNFTLTKQRIWLQSDW